MSQNAGSMRSLGRAGRLPALLIACATLAAAPASPPAPGPASGPAPVKVELNQLLQMHHWLMAYCASPPRPGYEPACAAYREARQGETGDAVWQFVNDACALGPDIQAVTARAGKLPETMSAKDAGVTRKLLGALGSAWPVYEANDLVALNRTLQRLTILELRQRFGRGTEPRVMPLVYEKMLLKPLDAPVTVFPVTHSTHKGDWGKTKNGYYLIQPMLGQPVSESLVHELTHLGESGQPAGERTLMRRLREALPMIDEATFEDFTHGLVVYTAGETVGRKTDDGAVRPYPESLSTWLPIYEKVWKPYLNGAAKPDDTIAALAAALLSRGSSPAPSSASP